MYRERVYVCPVPLDSLDHEQEPCRSFLLRALMTHGVKRISFARRGGSKEPLHPLPDEAMLVHGSAGRFGKPPEERWGCDTQCGSSVAIPMEVGE